jgi:hypothetical protein
MEGSKDGAFSSVVATVIAYAQVAPRVHGEDVFCYLGVAFVVMAGIELLALDEGAVIMGIVGVAGIASAASVM